MKQLRSIVIALLATLMIMPHGAALHCNGEVTTVEVGADTLYVEYRPTASADHILWVYLESNGVDGLQSGGDSYILQQCPLPVGPFLCVHDPCYHPSPDTRLFPGIWAP